MDVPPSSDPKWVDLVKGSLKYKYEFLPANILMIRILMNTSRDSSAATIEKAVSDLRELLHKNAHRQEVQRDLQKIFQ